MNYIKKYIERQAEINAAENLIELSEDIKNERQSIVNILKIKEVIELDTNGGFHFIGNEADKNKAIYLEAFNNF
jgi:hypothetical protein